MMTEIHKIAENDYTVVYRGQFTQRYFRTETAAARYIQRRDFLSRRYRRREE